MTGDALQNQFMRNISNGFFKATLLEQWTKAVQLASFTTGKRLIRENTEQLYKLKNGTLKLKKKESEFLKNLKSLIIFQEDLTTVKLKNTEIF